MSIKLIAIDIDGTLIDDNHLLPVPVINSLKKKITEGVKVVLCSGRPIIGMLPFVKELGLDTADQYTISYNGALVQHNKDFSTLIQHTLTYEEFLAFEALSQELGVDIQVVDLEGIYTPSKEISPYTVFDAYATGMPLHYRAVTEFEPKMLINKLMFCAEPDVLSEAIKKIPPHLFEEYYLVNSMPFYFEILNKQASKGQAVKELAEKLGFTAEEVMVIGDNENDVDMLEYAGLSIAMGNATPNVKANADHITKTNNENGVAYAVDTWA